MVLLPLHQHACNAVLTHDWLALRTWRYVEVERSLLGWIRHVRSGEVHCKQENQHKSEWRS